MVGSMWWKKSFSPHHSQKTERKWGQEVLHIPERPTSSNELPSPHRSSGKNSPMDKSIVKSLSLSYSAFCCCDKMLGKSNWGDKRLYLAHMSRPVYDWGKPQPELKQKPWRNVTCWLALHNFLSLLFNINHDFLPRSGTAHSRTLPDQSLIINQSLIKKMLHTLVPIWWRRVSQLCSPFPKNQN